MTFATQLLVKYPNIQERLAKELIQVFPDGKMNIRKLQDLPLLKAFIYETLRISTPAPLGFPRECTKELKIQVGKHTYIIPKGVCFFCSDTLSHPSAPINKQTQNKDALFT